MCMLATNICHTPWNGPRSRSASDWTKRTNPSVCNGWSTFTTPPVGYRAP